MYVARPGQAEAKRLVDKYDKSERRAEPAKAFAIGLVIATTLAAILTAVVAMIQPIVWQVFTPQGKVFMPVLVLYLVLAGVLSLVWLSYKLVGSFAKRQLKPYLENGDVLEVDSSIARRWRNEQANDKRIDQGDLFELQARFNVVFTAWRRDLTDS